MLPITLINTHMIPVMIMEPKANISEERWTQRRYLSVNIIDQKTIPVMIIEPKVNIKYKDNWPKENKYLCVKIVDPRMIPVMIIVLSDDTCDDS